MNKLVMPLDVTPTKSHRPCESCGVKNVGYKVSLNPPGERGVTMKLCENCKDGLGTQGTPIY